jgi:hypothetical protein
MVFIHRALPYAYAIAPLGHINNYCILCLFIFHFALKGHKQIRYNKNLSPEGA